jgi:hypothetical protein
MTSDARMRNRHFRGHLREQCCLGCGVPLPPYYSGKYCQNTACPLVWRFNHRPKPRRRSAGHATHIAGYVPPRGSIAWHFLGRVVAPLV